MADIRRNTIGVVLIGGRSTRMGSDKALLDVEGCPMYRRQAILLRQAGCDQVLYAGAVPGVQGISDAKDFQGPLAGIAGIVAECQQRECDPAATQLLIVPVDMPLLRAELCEYLCAMAAAPALHFDGFPLPSLVSLEAAEKALLQLAQERVFDSSLRHWLKRMQATPLALPQAWVSQMQNANTPQQWQQMLAQKKQREHCCGACA